ncbi:Zn-ribbon domain-containing OB-fold protein [Methanothermococcus sp.]|uniref:Zn-ribbon domain-containing OB-fold protein n=1 Tax=Methanothermococcus sp. TaxID=2614238 RepID=UPI0025DD344F|nr:Zn-ribbon domain-containing OB-fold protein [Methanothermococcus sp.]
MVVRTWRHINERYNLIGTRCKTCGTVYFPSRNVCPKCRRRGELEPYKLSGKGKIYTYSIIYTPPKDFEKMAPYVIAVIELDEGPKLTAQVDCDINEVYIGMPVEVAFRRIKEDGKDGVISYGYKFKPIEEL